MRTGRRLLMLRLGFVAAIGILPFAVGTSSPAASSLGGWKTTADANVVDITIDNATGLAGVHPFTEADFPEAESEFGTGPFGSALASIFWPGSAGGNFGSLSAELPIPAQLEPILSKLNDPARASTQYPAGPDSDTFPKGATSGAFDAQAKSTASGSTALGDLSNVSNSFISFSGAKSSSSATATSTAKATASSDLGGISILGGLIDIGEVTSTATATSDGTTASGSSTTHVSGITIMGQPASIGTDGLILPTFTNSGLFGVLTGLTGPIVHDLLSQVINGLGLTVTEFPVSQTINGASGTVTSGGLRIGIDPPAALATTLETVFGKLAPLFPPQAAIIPTLPGLLQGATVTITIGRSTATANASPPFNTGPVTPPPVSTPPSTPSNNGVSTPAVNIRGTPGHFIPGSSTPGSGSPAFGNMPTSQSNSQPTQLSTKPIDVSSPLSTGALVLAILGTLALGLGLFRLARLLLPEDVGPICPLGQETV